jgi:hypothetical protein
MRRIFRERRFRRCVGRRREEPAARRRATNGHVQWIQLPVGPSSVPRSNESPRSLSPCFIAGLGQRHGRPGSRCGDWFRGGLGRRSNRHGLRHSSKHVANPRSKTSLRSRRVSPRAFDATTLFVPNAVLDSLGLVLPRASSTNFRRSGSKCRAHRRINSKVDEHRPFRTLRVTYEVCAHRNSCASLGVEDPNTDAKRANAQRRCSNPKRVRNVEASGVAPPLPPSRRRFRFANESKVLRATPFAVLTSGRS